MDLTDQHNIQKKLKVHSKVRFVNDLLPFVLLSLAQELRRLREANAGAIGSVRWMLEVAYGRRGKLRSEILSVICSETCSLETL